MARNSDDHARQRASTEEEQADAYGGGHDHLPLLSGVCGDFPVACLNADGVVSQASTTGPASGPASTLHKSEASPANHSPLNHTPLSVSSQASPRPLPTLTEKPASAALRWGGRCCQGLCLPFGASPIKDSCSSVSQALPKKAPRTLLAATRDGFEEEALDLLRRTDPEDMGKTDAEGCCALHHASRRGFRRLCDALVDSEPPDSPLTDCDNHPNPSDSPPSFRRALTRKLSGKLFRARTRQLVRVLTRQNSRLLSLKTNWINSQDSSGGTALHSAARQGHAEVVAWLCMLPLFTEADRPDHTGQTAFHHAASHGHTRACLALLAAQRTGRLGQTWAFKAVQAKDSEGCTALHRAAEGGHTQVCATLCAHDRFSAAARAVDGQGWTVLHRAARAGHFETCKTLLEWVRPARGLLQVRDYEGRLALHLAAAGDHPKTCTCLLDAWSEQCESKGDLSQFFRMAYRALAQDLHAEGAGDVGVNARDYRGRTVLHVAAMAGAALACEALVKHPSTDMATIVDRQGRTSAEVAVGKAKRFFSHIDDDLRVFRRDW